MKMFGQTIGQILNGGEVIELIGDVGAGKTTLVKGIATGLGVDEEVQSPSFTINRVYGGRDGITLSHYDFYRLGEAGIMINDLSESINDSKTVTVIEWGEITSSVLPDDRLVINIISPTEDTRELTIKSNGASNNILAESLKL